MSQGTTLAIEEGVTVAIDGDTDDGGLPEGTATLTNVAVPGNGADSNDANSGGGIAN